MSLLEAYGASGMSSMEFGLSIQRKLLPGLSAVHLFGRSADIDISDGFYTLWNGATTNYTGFDATQEEFISLSSDNPADTGLVLLVLGLDMNFNQISETIVLGGVPVFSALKYLRLSEAFVVTPNGENQGSITIRQSITTVNIFAIMAPKVNRTLLGLYTVPNNKEAYIFSGFASIAKKQSAVCEVRAKSRRVNSSFQIAEWFSLDSKASSYVYREFKIPLAPAPAGTDIYIEANTDTNNTKVAGGLEIVLVDA